MTVFVIVLLHKQACLSLSDMTKTLAHPLVLFVRARARTFSPPSFAFFNLLRARHWLERSPQMPLYGDTNRISSRR